MVEEVNSAFGVASLALARFVSERFGRCDDLGTSVSLDVVQDLHIGRPDGLVEEMVDSVESAIAVRTRGEA